MKDIQRIIGELEQQQEAITRAIAALREVGGDTVPRPRKPGAKPAPKKRVISPEGRARISAAAKARWAAERAAKAAAQSEGGKKRAPRKRDRKKPAAAAE